MRKILIITILFAISISIFAFGNYTQMPWRIPWVIISDSLTVNGPSDFDSLYVAEQAVIEGDATLSSDLKLSSTNDLYFDGGTNTYISESSADVMDFVTGGKVGLGITEDTDIAWDIDGVSFLNFDTTSDDVDMQMDMNLQFPLEMLADDTTYLANTDSDSAVDGTTIGSYISVNDNAVLGVLGDADGSGGADGYRVDITDGVLVHSTETVTCSSDAGTAAVTCDYSFITTENNATADVLTLADGNFTGQEKYIELTTDGGDDLEVTPTNFANGTKITLDTAGESVTLVWNGSNWTIKSHYGGVVA